MPPTLLQKSESCHSEHGEKSFGEIYIEDSLPYKLLGMTAQCLFFHRAVYFFRAYARCCKHGTRRSGTKGYCCIYALTVCYAAFNRSETSAF